MGSIFEPALMLKEYIFIECLVLGILAIPYCTILLILEYFTMPFSLTTLRKINVDRNSRQQKLSQIVSLLNMTAKSYFETLINYDQNSKTYVPGNSVAWNLCQTNFQHVLIQIKN